MNALDEQEREEHAERMDRESHPECAVCDREACLDRYCPCPEQVRGVTVRDVGPRGEVVAAAVHVACVDGWYLKWGGDL